jgi:hypothetical protein
MTELTDVSGAFGYSDSILAGERVRLRGEVLMSILDHEWAARRPSGQ